jgi:glycosyltransferase involved in cell wall biosynthesis
MSIPDLTLGIKTLLRPNCLFRLLESISTFYPGTKIVIVDDGPEPMQFQQAAAPEVQYIKLPYDTGLGASRNVMIDAVKTPYFCYLDDDFVFTLETHLDWMLDPIRAGQADLVGGQFWEGTRYRLFHGLLEMDGTTLVYKQGNRGVFGCYGRTYERVDIVNNFWVGRTEHVRQTGWDPELKINTHTDFFLRASKRMQIAYCRDASILHQQVREPVYNQLRNRRFRAKVWAKHGITASKKIGAWG